MIWDALILAGGRGSRLGGVDKGSLRIGGRTLLERLMPAVRPARRVVAVGDDEAMPGSFAVTVREEPRFGGPVAATAAGLAVLPGGPGTVALLAVDMPYAAEALPLLLAAWDGTADGVTATDSAGRQPLLALYRTERLREAADALVRERGTVTGSSMRELLAPLDLRDVPVPDRLTADVDTPADAERHGIAVCPPTQEGPPG